MTNQNNQKYYPPLHTLIYGVPHAGKSTFASTFPKPMIVFCFDPFGKDLPYLKQGAAIKHEGVDELGTSITRVYDEKDQLLIQVEDYTDPDATSPVNRAADRFAKRVIQFRQEVDYWKTAVVDSVTFMELAYRLYNKYVLNTKDGRQVYGIAKERMEETLLVNFGHLRMNVIAVAHEIVDKDEDTGLIVRGIHVVGKLSQFLPAGYGDLYKINIDPTGKRSLQTVSNSLWAASSSIDAPNPCEPHYNNLWVNYKPIIIKQ